MEEMKKEEKKLEFNEVDKATVMALNRNMMEFAEIMKDLFKEEESNEYIAYDEEKEGDGRIDIKSVMVSYGQSRWANDKDFKPCTFDVLIGSYSNTTLKLVFERDVTRYCEFSLDKVIKKHGDEEVELDLKEVNIG